MNKLSFYLILLIVTISNISNEQQSSETYKSLIKDAYAFYLAKLYLKSATTYSKAFRANSGQALPDDRYNAACAWALANQIDSAFYHLEFLAKEQDFTNYSHVTNDTDLKSLCKDPRWSEVLKLIQENKAKAERNYIMPLVLQLDSIYEMDQKYRQQFEPTYQKYGSASEQMKSLVNLINRTDSINLEKVKSILDRYGWLGPDQIGERGNTTLFLVVQHSDKNAREKYLPLMREAVKNRNANPQDLAKLEDRTALGQGKKQIFGTQIRRDEQTQKFYLSPLEDPDNVNKRRMKLGLPPLEEYLIQWGITWNVEEYKKGQITTRDGG